MSNPALAPRAKSCVICREVDALEHIAILMYAENGLPLPNGPVYEYLRSIGVSGTNRAMYGRVTTHRQHIDRWLANGAHVVPAQIDDGVTRVPARTGPVRWIDAQQNAIDLGNEALRSLASRMAVGELDPKEEIALAKLGVNAANTRGSMEQKGKALSGIDRLLQLAAGGLDPSQEGSPG